MLPFSTGANAQIGETAAQPVADERRDGVGDRAALVADDGLEAGDALERQHLAVAGTLPLVHVALVTGVRCVHADRDPGVGDRLPEGVELGKRRRTGSHEPEHRGGPDEDDAGAAVEHPLELLDRLVENAHVDDRGREDPVLVVEGPVLVHPLVERVDHRVGGRRIAAQALLEQAGERRPHEGPVDAELVHQLQPRLGVVESRE